MLLTVPTHSLVHDGLLRDTVNKLLRKDTPTPDTQPAPATVQASVAMWTHAYQLFVFYKVAYSETISILS